MKIQIHKLFGVGLLSAVSIIVALGVLTVGFSGTAQAAKECHISQPSGHEVCSENGKVISDKPVKGSGAVNAQDTKGKNIDPLTKQQVYKTSVVDYINAIYAYLAGVGGLLAVIMLVYAGYRYMTSYGDPEKIADAKDIIEKTLIGLGLLIMAAVILNTINPRTTSNPCQGSETTKSNKNPGATECGDIDFTKANGGK